MKALRFKLVSAVSVCLLGTALLAGNVSGMTNLISGDVTNSVAWSGTNLLQGAVVVRSNVVLTIEPGTRLLMGAGATLLVYGQLLANGTSNQPIYFTRATASTNWQRIRFVGAADSRLGHCVIEFANSAGSHQDYYDNDCNTSTPPLARNYHEAVVAVATRLEIEGCVFRYLPSNTSSAEGDAIAIISDDPQNPGSALARIRNCQFLSIGQGVHTRFSYVLVENCLFSGKRGDNDDVDLYGESTPPPLIRNNVFLSGHEDKINPTRCSAIIVRNIISGSDDHGIVLRDKCSPIVMNNLIYNCTSAGLAVQNQCDALIANNTIVNCQRGVRFFDHDQRWGPPYCLFPGSGSATIINCLIWDCATPLELANSPFTQDRGSHAKVFHCNIEGGQAATSVSSESTLLWGADNINADPQFVGFSTNNYRLRSGSPCIDAGTNVSVIATNFSVIVTNDFDGLARPLDGNGDGLARFDIQGQCLA
ncbi:MAG: right-handed parallel beta-helix repeat-containing protein [Verrucomicrobiota bacterium]